MSTTRNVASPQALVGTAEPDYRLDEPLDPDYAGLYRSIPAADREYLDRARSFVREEVLPVIAGHWDRAEYPVHLARRLGELDLLRDGVDVPGLPRQSRLAAGLVTAELARGDGSIATIVAVQGALALRSIAELGSPEQKALWLPLLADGRKLGAFALTEPTHGSDAVSLETRAVRTANGFRITGEKKWIGNGSVGDVTVTWARGDDGHVHGFLVPQSANGYVATTIEGKGSLRAIWQAHIRYLDVQVGADAMLPLGRSFSDTSRVLRSTRLGVAWAALGHATAVCECAVHYARQRVQFGRPLSASQLVQDRLARMLAELTQLQALVFRFTELDERGELGGVQAAIAKVTATRTARSLAADARDLLGGNGILLEHRVFRHLADIESLHTYEGTESVQSLIIGRDITGISAFA